MSKIFSSQVTVIKHGVYRVGMFFIKIETGEKE